MKKRVHVHRLSSTRILPNGPRSIFEANNLQSSVKFHKVLSDLIFSSFIDRRRKGAYFVMDKFPVTYSTLYSYICFSKYFSWSDSHPAFSNKMNACIRQRWRWRSEWRGWRMKYALSRQARRHLLPIASMNEEDRLLNLTTRRNRAYTDLSITKICPRRFHFFFQFKEFPDLYIVALVSECWIFLKNSFSFDL